MRRAGKPLVLNYDYQRTLTPELKAEVEWMVRQFAKIGVQLEIRATDFNRFQEKAEKGSLQIFWWGWFADYPDAENFLFLLYGPNSKALTGGNGENAANYSNAEFDRLFDELKYLDDGQRKQQVMDRMIAITQHDAPWTFGYNPYAGSVQHQWVGNAKPGPLVNDRLMFMKVDPALRAARIAEWNRPIWWPVALIVLALVVAVVPAFRAWKRRERETAGRRVAARRRADVLAYIARRCLYAVLILIGVNLLTFTLFFAVNSPDNIARLNIGAKRVTADAIEKWKAERGYDKPLWFNAAEEGGRKITNTIFHDRSLRLFTLDFGSSDSGRDIRHEVGTRIQASLALAGPMLLLTVFVSIAFSLLLVFFRATYLDFWGTVLCVVMMSISSLFYIIMAQWLFGKTLQARAALGLRAGAGSRSSSSRCR